jgi:hypothetical protein
MFHKHLLASATLQIHCGTTVVSFTAQEDRILTSVSFTQHPSAVGETYRQHLQSALSFSFGMISGGVACFVHGIFPFLFTNTGSSMIRRLHERMVLNRTSISLSPTSR